MGATGLSYDLARQFGLRVSQPRPGLVPFIVTAPTMGLAPALAGVSLETVATCGKQSFREKMLFTHRGLSGPAILQISSYWREGDAITLDLLPDHDAAAFLVERKRTRPKASPQTVLAEIMPARLAQVLTVAHLPAGELANISDRALAVFAARLKQWHVRPEQTEGYAKAEVTLGGIDTRDVSSKTMAAHNVTGLYAIGEAVDVTGWLGGGTIFSGPGPAVGRLGRPSSPHAQPLFGQALYPNRWIMSRGVLSRTELTERSKRMGQCILANDVDEPVDRWVRFVPAHHHRRFKNRRFFRKRSYDDPRYIEPLDEGWVDCDARTIGDELKQGRAFERLDDDAGKESLATAEIVDDTEIQPPDRWLSQNELLIGKTRQRYLAQMRQRMPLRKHDPQRLAGERNDLEAGIEGVLHRHADIELPRFDEKRLLIRPLPLQTDADSGKHPAKLGESRHQGAMDGKVHVADVDMPSHALGRFSRHAYRAVDLKQGQARLIEEHLAGARKLNPARRSDQKLGSDHRLDALDCPGQGRLGDVETPRGLGKAQLLAHRNEGSKLANVDRHCSHPWYG